MHDLTHIRSIVALAWSLVLIAGGGVVLWLLEHHLVIHVWQLYLIVPAFGGLLGLTAAWIRDELRS